MGRNVWGVQVFSAARADSFFMSIREHVFKRDVSLGMQVHSPLLAARFSQYCLETFLVMPWEEKVLQLEDCS